MMSEHRQRLALYTFLDGPLQGETKEVMVSGYSYSPYDTYRVAIPPPMPAMFNPQTPIPEVESIRVLTYEIFGGDFGDFDLRLTRSSVIDWAEHLRLDPSAFPDKRQMRSRGWATLLGEY